MLQLTQNLKTGKMELSEVPVPAIGKGKVLVRNHYSVISAGTEGGKVSTARKGYIGKAKEKPAQVKQVIDTLKAEGLASTYRRVMNKLDALSPLGYSAAGVVEEVGEGVTRFRKGDRVALGGEGAAHAEVGCVAENLLVKVPDNVDLRYAAYSTVSAIAMQGIRQADLSLGESCAVIGLGLLGQLTVQMLKAAGVRVAGVDIDPAVVELALQSGADIAFTRGSGDEEQAIIDFADGYGVDAVIITAGTSSLDPVEVAGKLCRRKGKVVIVGAVPTGFSRESYYRKELELRMATSYGPGRYDPEYEEKGLDYPIGYVRWTENRNMGAFLQLLSDGKLDIPLLTTHEFEFKDAPDAYEMIVSHAEPHVGIVLKYDVESSVEASVEVSPAHSAGSDLKVSFIGAGSFAQNLLLPNVGKAEMVTVATSQGHTSKNVAQKWDFSKATCDAKEVFRDDSNVLFIATRHDSHAGYVMEGLKAGKNVFVEKPLCLTEEELEEIVSIYREVSSGTGSRLMVGFNRRFAPGVRTVKKEFSDSVPKSINYRINAGNIPADHWIQDRETGGGRIIGEVCHFVDLAMFLVGSLPKSLSASAMEDPGGLLDTLNVNILFKDGSIANVSYFANGSKAMKKERIEVFSSGKAAVIDDFSKLDIYRKSKSSKSGMSQDKGHAREVREFLDSVRNGEPAPISFEEIYYSTKMSFDIIRSITSGDTVQY